MTGPVEGQGPAQNKPKPQQPEPPTNGPNSFKEQMGATSSPQSQNEQADTKKADRAWTATLQALFPGRTITPKEVAAFRRTLLQNISNQIKLEMTQEKKAAEKLKRANEGGGI